MRPISGLSVFLALAAPLGAAADPASDARLALDKYYAERLGRPFLRLPDDPEPKPTPPPWEAAVKQLASDQVEERRAGAAYLRALLDLALADESSGKATWRNTPYWGGGADVPARDLRDLVARELATARPSAEVLPLLLWYLENEPADRFLVPVVEALGRSDGGDAHALRAELATRPHPNAMVTAGAIKQITARRMTLPADKLATLCQHHRTPVRSAARALNDQQGGNDPGPFDPAKAVRSGPVAQVMNRVFKLMPDLPGVKAAYVNVTVRYLDDKKAERHKDEVRGWLIKDEKGVVEVYTPYGRVRGFRDEHKTTVRVREQTADGGETSVDVPVVTELAVTPIGTDDLVKTVAASRTGGDAGNELSENGGLAGQFRGPGATLAEAILGAWLYRAGKDADAATVLLPALDSAYRDDHLVLVARGQLGELLVQKMLVAFAGDRDYPAAIRHAKQICDLYPDTRFHPYAKDLVTQLPNRMDDFTGLKLPTPKEWTELKKSLTRDEQIDFLCERMRLLNCFQTGQPGGYDPGETQYAEPCGLSENAAWCGGRGKTEVINPWTELTGDAGEPGDGKPKRPGLGLTVKDVSRLSKYLRDDHYMLVVRFWRDFAPDPSLSSTRPQFAGIINGLAKRDLARTHDTAGMTSTEVDAHIQKVVRWVTANADKSEQELLWDALEEDVEAGVPWGRLGNARRLIELKDKRMLRVLRKYLDETTSDYDLHSLFYWCLEYDPSAFTGAARRFAKHKTVGLRLAAGHILFAGGERAEGTKLFADILANGSPGQLEQNALPKLIGTLLKDGSRDSKATARLIFRNKRYTEISAGWVRTSLVRQCAEACIGDGYLSYIPLLEIRGNSIGNVSYSSDTVVGELIAAEIIDTLAPTDSELLRIKQAFPKPVDRIGPLTEWLRTKAKAVASP